MMKLVPLVALLGCLFLGGCSEASEPGQDERLAPSSETPGPATPTVVAIPLNIKVGVGNQTSPAGDVSVMKTGAGPLENGAPVPVQENATAMMIEARWECTTPSCGFHLRLKNGDNQDILRVPSDGTVAAMVPANVALTPGDWPVWVAADSAFVDMAGEIRVSVFYGGPIPDGYSAF